MAAGARFGRTRIASPVNAPTSQDRPGSPEDAATTIAIQIAATKTSFIGWVT